MIEDTTVGEDLLVAGSGSAGDVIVLLSSQVMGTTDITGGDGGDTVIIGSATFGGDFQLQTGAGADTVSVAPGRIDYKAIQYVPVVRVENGIEVTVFVPEEIESATFAGAVDFDGTAIMNLGNGNDTLYLATGAEVIFTLGATLDGQEGQNIAHVQIGNLPFLPTYENFTIET